MFDLRRFRKDKNLTQKSLASILEVDQSFISNIEKRIRPIPEKYVVRLRELYGDDVEYYIDNGPSTYPTNTIPAGKVMDIIGEYQARLDKKDEQIQSLIEIIHKELDELKSGMND